MAGKFSHLLFMLATVELLCLIGSNRDKSNFLMTHSKLDSAILLMLYKSLDQEKEYQKDASHTSDYQVKLQILCHQSCSFSLANKILAFEKNLDLKVQLNELIVSRYPILNCPSLFLKCFKSSMKYPQSKLLFSRLLIMLASWSFIFSFLFLGISNATVLVSGIGLSLTLNLLWYISSGFTALWLIKARLFAFNLFLSSLAVPMLAICMPLIAFLILTSWIRGESIFEELHGRDGY